MSQSEYVTFSGLQRPDIVNLSGDFDKAHLRIECCSNLILFQRLNPYVKHPFFFKIRQRGVYQLSPEPLLLEVWVHRQIWMPPIFVR